MTAVALSIGIAAGVRPTLLALAVGALVAPVPTALAVCVFALVARPGRDAPASVRLAEVAGSCRAGATLRESLARVLPDDAARRLRAGHPWADVSEAIDRAFGSHGSAVRTAVGLLSRQGGPTAGVFAELASQAVTDEVLASERSAGAAPSLAQAAVIGGVPAVVLVHALLSGRLERLAELGPAGATLAWGGALATVTGVAMVVAMLWRART